MNIQRGVIFEFPVPRFHTKTVRVFVRSDGNIQGWWIYAPEDRKLADERLRSYGGWPLDPDDVDPATWAFLNETAALVSKGEIPCE